MAEDESHRALLERLGLRSLMVVPIVSRERTLGIMSLLSTASGPSAAQLADIRAILAGSEAICVFPEAGRDPKFIASLTEGLQVRVGAAQDIEFAMLDAGPGQYAVLLRALAASLTDCLAAN